MRNANTPGQPAGRVEAPAGTQEGNPPPEPPSTAEVVEARQAADAHIAEVCDVEGASVVRLIRELATYIDVYAPHVDPAVDYRLEPPGPGLIYRDLDGGAGLVDLHDVLSPEALAVLAEILAAEKDVIQGGLA